MKMNGPRRTVYALLRRTSGLTFGVTYVLSPVTRTSEIKDQACTAWSSKKRSGSSGNQNHPPSTWSHELPPTTPPQPHQMMPPR
ncbi:hypothetical protein MRX96_011210 [Rhipicephalus microplus]